MASSAPLFYKVVQDYLDWALLLVSVIVQVVALVHCLTQRGDGFTAIGTLPKGIWAIILVVCIVLSVFLRGEFLIFPLIGIAAALVYLLDVRPGLRGLSDGKGSW